ncbi:hypothetical protein D7H67_05800 [Bacillus sp. S66]|nr:hypothetical protein D7H67_05800 [Bacillus sp. S66]
MSIPYIYLLWCMINKWRDIIKMNYKVQLQILRLSLEDKIRGCRHTMMLRQNKILKNEMRIYNELLAMLNNLKRG